MITSGVILLANFSILADNALAGPGGGGRELVEELAVKSSLNVEASLALYERLYSLPFRELFLIKKGLDPCDLVECAGFSSQMVSQYAEIVIEEKSMNDSNWYATAALALSVISILVTLVNLPLWKRSNSKF